VRSGVSFFAPFFAAFFTGFFVAFFTGFFAPFFAGCFLAVSLPLIAKSSLSSPLTRLLSFFPALLMVLPRRLDNSSSSVDDHQESRKKRQ